MLFNSLLFAVFFGAVLAIYYALPSWALRKHTLWVSSYLFYSAWNPPFVLLIMLSTVVDWFAARGIFKARSAGKLRTKRAWLILSLCTNLGLLAYFKYGGFVLENFQALAASMGIHYQPLQWNIILPVGISFYTFQTLSYTIDIYRGNLKPAKKFADFALFVSFFPQLVAGPIVRAKDFLPQLAKKPAFNIENFSLGLMLVIAGVFMKVICADAWFAPTAEAFFNKPALLNGSLAPTLLAAWAGTFAFAGQIYFDFCGYSTSAVGAALCLGFALPKNFNCPYAATGFSDFWRRWHISLSTWLRDYVYIPLGGNRCTTRRMYINLLLTMLIGGLWHGAAWTFVAWGALHGLFLVTERLTKTYIFKPSGAQNAQEVTPRKFNFICTTLPAVLLTFVCVNVAWVFFRAESFASAWAVLGGMVNFSSVYTAVAGSTFTLANTHLAFAFAGTLALLAGHLYLRKQDSVQWARSLPYPVQGVALGVMLYLVATTTNNSAAFIYFQF